MEISERSGLSKPPVPQLTWPVNDCNGVSAFMATVIISNDISCETGIHCQMAVSSLSFGVSDYIVHYNSIIRDRCTSYAAKIIIGKRLCYSEIPLWFLILC